MTHGRKILGLLFTILATQIRAEVSPPPHLRLHLIHGVNVLLQYAAEEIAYRENAGRFLVAIQDNSEETQVAGKDIIVAGENFKVSAYLKEYLPSQLLGVFPPDRRVQKIRFQLKSVANAETAEQVLSLQDRYRAKESFGASFDVEAALPVPAHWRGAVEFRMDYLGSDDKLLKDVVAEVHNFYAVEAQQRTRLEFKVEDIAQSSELVAGGVLELSYDRARFARITQTDQRPEGKIYFYDDQNQVLRQWEWWGVGSDFVRLQIPKTARWLLMRFEARDPKFGVDVPPGRKSYAFAIRAP